MVMSNDSSPTNAVDSIPPTQAQLLHTLSNKLLPIVVFTELALRQCQDEKVKQQLNKIQGAAGDAREIILELRKHQMEAANS